MQTRQYIPKKFHFTNFISPKRSDDFEQVPLPEDATVYHVLYTVTFGTTSATGLHKRASHVLTDRLGEKR